MPRATAATVPSEEEEAPQSRKPSFPIYFSIATDGPMPGAHNLLHVHAWFSEELQWKRNILPQNGEIRRGARLSDEVVEGLRVGAIPVRQAMEELQEWLSRFQGIRTPVTSALAFWHLIYHMQQVTDKIPFASNCVDVGSFYAGAHADLKAMRAVKGKDPARALEQRVKMVADAIAYANDMRW